MDVHGQGLHQRENMSKLSRNDIDISNVNNQVNVIIDDANDVIGIDPTVRPDIINGEFSYNIENIPNQSVKIDEFIYQTPLKHPKNVNIQSPSPSINSASASRNPLRSPLLEQQHKIEEAEGNIVRLKKELSVVYNSCYKRNGASVVKKLNLHNKSLFSNGGFRKIDLNSSDDGSSDVNRLKSSKLSIHELNSTIPEEYDESDSNISNERIDNFIEYTNHRTNAFLTKEDISSTSNFIEEESIDDDNAVVRKYISMKNSSKHPPNNAAQLRQSDSDLSLKSSHGSNSGLLSILGKYSNTDSPLDNNTTPYTSRSNNSIHSSPSGIYNDMVSKAVQTAEQKLIQDLKDTLKYYEDDNIYLRSKGDELEEELQREMDNNLINKTIIEKLEKINQELVIKCDIQTERLKSIQLDKSKLQSISNQYEDDNKTLRNELTVCRNQLNTKANKLGKAEAEITSYKHLVSDLQFEIIQMKEYYESKDRDDDMIVNDLQLTFNLNDSELKDDHQDDYNILKSNYNNIQNEFLLVKEQLDNYITENEHLKKQLEQPNGNNPIDKKLISDKNDSNGNTSNDIKYIYSTKDIPISGGKSIVNVITTTSKSRVLNLMLLAFLQLMIWFLLLLSIYLYIFNKSSCYRTRVRFAT